MQTVKKVPERTCIACKKVSDKRQLIRVVKSPEGEFFIDRTGKKNGRGAYLCNDRSCLEKCMKSKLLNRSFKCDIPGEVYENLLKEFDDGR